MNSVAILLGTFALCVFWLLNGPLWLSTTLRVFAYGPEAPHRLVVTAASANRAVGVAGILFWLAIVSRGNTLRAILLGIILVCGAFLLWNGPLWLVTRTPIFARGGEAPVRLQAAFPWFCRIAGAAATASVLYFAF